MNKRIINLCLVLTEGMSLQLWDEYGLLYREIALYRELINHGVHTTFVSFGNSDELKYYIHTIITKDFVSNDMLSKFNEETKKDPILQVLYRTIKNGWPECKNQVPQIIQPYFNYRQELTIFEGIILKDTRLVVPSSMKREMKTLLHSGHLGVVKTKSIARDSIYWPGIGKEIEDMIKNCDTCQIYQNKQKEETRMHHKIPKTPWTKIGTDLFELDAKDYLIVVDYTSNYFDISQLPNKKSSTVAVHTKRIFSKFGIPKTVMCDNGPEFIGKAYKNFSKNWDFEHDTSSPTYPESNGLVERTIQTVKKTLKKAFQDDQDPYLALLSIKVSPGPYNNSTPATIMFNRPIRSIIPTLRKDVQSSYVENRKIILKAEDTPLEKRNLPVLNIDDKVRLHDGKSWSIKGTVVRRLKYPRSYIIMTSKGTTLRRNRRDTFMQ